MSGYEPVQDPGTMPATIYTQSAGPAPQGLRMDGAIRADIAIIGGGFVGLSAAIQAASTGRDVVVLEGNRIGWGSAGRNAGQIAAHASKLEPSGVLSTYGPKYGPRLNEAGAHAPQMVMDMASSWGVDISVVKGGIFTGAHAPKTMGKLQRRAQFWQNAGADVEFLDKDGAAAIVGSDFYCGGVVDRRAIAINPLAFVYGLARDAQSKGVRIYEDARVTSVQPSGEGAWRLDLPQGSVHAKQILVCTNAYTGDLWPGLKQTVVAVRGYQIYTRPLPPEHSGRILRGISAMLDTRRLLTGMRLHRDGRLHFSGGIGFGAENEPDIKGSIARVQEILPGLPLEIEGWWSGWVTRGIADGWRLHSLAPGVATAIGCNGRGVAMGVIVGRELARYATGTPEDELILPLSAPHRVAGLQVFKPVAAMVQRIYGVRDRMEVRAARRKQPVGQVRAG